jgi:hypothetical protein
MEKNIKNENEQPKLENENEINLEIIELEDKVAPRNWNAYAVIN